MEQNLLIGDHLLVNKFVHAPTLSEFERTLLPIGEVQRGGRPPPKGQPCLPFAAAFVTYTGLDMPYIDAADFRTKFVNGNYCSI